jgi:deoxyribonuclease-4
MCIRDSRRASEQSLAMPRFGRNPAVVCHRRGASLVRLIAMKPILGAHMSIAGGTHLAVERAHEVTCSCVQIFSKNNNQWRAKPITCEQVEQFREALVQFGIGHPLIHSSYLINLAAPDRALWKKSIDAFIVELQRADQLRIPYVVLHPGAFTTSSEQAGIKRIIRALDEIHAQTRDLDSGCLLENTAGQGTCLGWRFEQLAAILDGVKAPERLGVCLDTCHAFAAGYGLTDPDDYRRTMKAFGQLIGFGRLKALHLNDSKRELGSRVDRHEQIGEGHLGNKAFRNVLHDRRMLRVPMYLETPKGTHPKTGKPWDLFNLRRLRRLAATR